MDSSNSNGTATTKGLLGISFDPDNILDEQNFMQASRLIESLEMGGFGLNMEDGGLALSDAAEGSTYPFIADLADRLNNICAQKGPGGQGSAAGGPEGEDFGAWLQTLQFDGADTLLAADGGAQGPWEEHEQLARQPRYLGSLTLDVIDLTTHSNGGRGGPKPIPGDDVLLRPVATTSTTTTTTSTATTQSSSSTGATSIEVCTADGGHVIGLLPQQTAGWVGPLLGLPRIKVEAHLPNDLDNGLAAVVKFYFHSSAVPSDPASAELLNAAEHRALSQLAAALGKELADLLPGAILEDGLHQQPYASTAPTAMPLSSPFHQQRNGVSAANAGRPVMAGPAGAGPGVGGSASGMNGGGGFTGVIGDGPLGQLGASSSNNSSMVNNRKRELTMSCSVLPPMAKRMRAGEGNRFLDSEFGNPGAGEPTANELQQLLKGQHAEIAEMEPSPALLLTLRSYQKQALSWMVARERSPQEIMGEHESARWVLPPEWREYTTSTGRKYYYNDTTKATTWDFPVQPDTSIPTNKVNLAVRGGILADQMGMGKTIEVLSLILTNNLREPNSSCAKSNLVVCPLSVLAQWVDEIRSHTGTTHSPLSWQGQSLILMCDYVWQFNAVSGHASIYIFHGVNRVKDPVFLAKHDVVITTYSTLAAELPNEKRGKSIDSNSGTPLENPSQCT